MKKRLLLLLLLPPAQPDSAEEPFWNFNWKHFPPRLPEKGRGRGSPPTPPPVRDSSEQLQSCSFLSRRMKGRETRGEGGGAAGLVGKLKARTGRGLHPPAQAEGKGTRGRGPVPTLGAWVPPSTSLSEEPGAGDVQQGLVPKSLPISLPPPKARTRGSPGSHQRGCSAAAAFF